MDARIREAQPADVPAILALIIELAEYERLSHEVVATEELIHNTLFGPKNVAEVLIAEDREGIAGFALFFHNCSSFLGRSGIYLEDLFVRPPHRGKGIGKQLLKHLARIAKQRGCGRLEWSVLDWNEDAIRFYKSIEAVPMDGWTVYRLTGPALDRLGEQSGSLAG